MKFKWIFSLAMVVVVMGCREKEEEQKSEYEVVTDENYALAETQIIFANYRDRIIAQEGGGSVWEE